VGIIAKNSPYFFGIDLGTSTSSIAFFRRGVPEIIKIGGQKCIPSVVHVREDGEILVGQQAKSKILVDPANTVASIKREMGNDAFSVEFQGRVGNSYGPADISAEILRALFKGAVDQTEELDLKGMPKYAVVCVPANFDDKKRNMTLDAAKLADVEVKFLLEEPVAAAIAYGFDKDRDQIILVYDMGGGTFDVSILEVETALGDRAAFKVRAKEGVPKLGGDDLDQKIMEMVNEKFKADTGLDIFDLKKDQGISSRHLREAQQKLKEAAEAAKKELSTEKAAQIQIPSFLKDEGGTVHHIDVEIARDDFDAAITDLITQSMEAVKKALEEAKLTIDDISRIVLVGGSTRVPLVRTMLTEMFGKEPFADHDPDVIVATGAAIYGASLLTPGDDVSEGDTVKEPINWIDAVTHNLGIEVYGRKFSKIIEKNTNLSDDQPMISASRYYTTPRDDVTDLSINVYQALDDVEYVTDEGAVCIGELFVTGIPAAPKGSEKITVKFDIDRQNLLKVEASCVSTDGATKSLEIQRS